MDPFMVLERLYSRGVNDWQGLDLGMRGRLGVVVVVVGTVVVVVVWVVVDEWFDGSLDVGQQRPLVGIFGEVGRGRGWGWWQAFTEWQTLRIWHLTYESFIVFLSLSDVALNSWRALQFCPIDLGWRPHRPPGVSAQFPLLPDNLTGRSCPTKQDLPHPRYDPQAVAQPLGSLEDKALYGLILLLSLSGLAARVYTDKMTGHGQ